MAQFSMQLKSFWSRLKTISLGLLDAQFLRDLTVRILAGLGLAMLALIWIYCLFNFTPTDYLVPLRYNSFLGVTALGAWYQLYTVPLVLLFIYLLNIFLANAAYSKDRLISYILLGTNLFVIGCGATVIISLGAILNR